MREKSLKIQVKGTRTVKYSATAFADDFAIRNCFTSYSIKAKKKA
jgi:hypothetical protein